MKNSIDKEGLDIIERPQVKKYAITLKMGLYAILLLLLTFLTQLFLRSERDVFLFFAGLDMVILVQFALLAKERNKSKRSDALLSTMLKTTKGCCWVWNAATQHFCSSPKSYVLFGRDIETYEDFITLIHPDDTGEFQEAVLRFYSSLCSFSSPSFPGGMFEMEFRARSVDGDWRWFVARSGFVEYVSNRVARIRGSMLDIDTYKRAVEAIRSSEAATHSSIEAMRSSIKAMRSSAENQRWLFDFFQQFNQFDGIVQLFEALKDN
jgi:PAS domain-containing protein